MQHLLKIFFKNIFWSLEYTKSITIFMTMKSRVVTFKAKEDFYAHIEAEAKRRGLPVGTYIKAVLARFSKFKEKPVV